jgi:hypothetical protein
MLMTPMIIRLSSIISQSVLEGLTEITPTAMSSD